MTSREDNYIEYGGFPEIALEKDALIRDKILEEYFESLVYRDLAERHRMENTPLLKDMLKNFFSATTLLFSVNAYYKTVKQTLPVSRETIMDYFGKIRETGYFYFLPKFSWSLKEQRVNPHKIICLDLGMRNRVTLRFSKEEGRMAENLVGSMIARNEKPLYYWEGEQEVDFVSVGPKGLEAVNVTYGPTIPDREAESLIKFKKHWKRVNSLTLVTRDKEGSLGPIRCIPLWKWLLRR